MDFIQILLFIILFLLSAFFSGTEIALMSLSQHKIESLVKKAKFGSACLKKIKKNNDRLLITILIGNNLVNTSAAAFATAIAISIAKSGGMGLNEASAVGISTGIVTFLLLLFGEIIPKSIATKNSTNISLIVAPIYKILMILLYPIIILLEVIIKIFSKKTDVEEITEEEVESFMDIGKETGAIKYDEHKKIKNILEFSNTDVEEIMTPRIKIEAVSNNITVEKAIKYFMSHTHSRIPVYDSTIDKITHIMSVRDILDKDKNKKLKDLELREVLRVPLNQHIDSVLKVFQNSRRHLAIVMDEYGGVAGLITLEDIMEEIFGEIRDETDKETDDIRKVGSDSLIVDSSVLFEELLEKLNLDYNDLGLSQQEFSGETISYMLTGKLKRFPSNGEKIIFKIISKEKNKGTRLEFKVLDITESKIGDIEIKKI